ncbi:MAG: hypothetical protein HYT80_09940 [Euryarchaeota archaeon]|nr:hypothetical protein [Euryarchaeota archaeon]
MEETIERYEEVLRDMIPQVPVRASLATLFQGGEGHHQLKEALATTTREAEGLEEALDTEDVLQVLLECEKLAHAFYIDQLDRLSNPKLVTLFKRLAEEELAHMHAVEDAMRRLRELPTRAAVPVRS